MRIQIHHRRRKGAVLPMFGFLLPAIFIVCGLAINIAHMRLVKTEMKIAVDAASHAAGRAMSIHQTTDAAISEAQRIAALNYVNNSPLIISGEDDDAVIFCATTRGSNGYGRYEFDPKTKAAVDDQSARATSVRVFGSMDVPLLVRAIPGVASFDTHIYSTATQVDRDIALVLDRSGSMLYYQDEAALEQALYDLLHNVALVPTGYYETREYEVEVEVEVPYYVDVEETITIWIHYSWYWYITSPPPADVAWQYFQYDYTYTVTETRYRTEIQTQTRTEEVWVEDGYTTEPDPLITQQEYDNATEFLYDRTYSQNVVDQLQAVSVNMHEYTSDWRANNSGDTGAAPRHSRWALLSEGVEAFLTVLEDTDQEEQVSLVTFSSSATQETSLLKDFDEIRTYLDGVQPYGGTAIHYGLETGLPPIINDPNARLFASKTIVVLTDGENNDTSVDLGQTVTNLMGQHNITVHAMTFTPGADQDAMVGVAEAGFGKHYHADTGDVLVDHFEEIANNLPTILTE